MAGCDSKQYLIHRLLRNLYFLVKSEIANFAENGQNDPAVSLSHCCREIKRDHSEERDFQNRDGLS
ncbi:MAG TPA: hypothetical protein DEB39_04740 [Planctomycetaceae bacterium]|nr:hypothetical protein [Planctomycetaceae bacterium]